MKELQRGLKRADDGTDKELRKEFKKVGDLVRVEAMSRFSGYDAGSASGYRTRVRQKGIAVEQSRRKTTGKRKDYAALQNRKAMWPALDAKHDEVVDRLEEAVERIADMVKR